MQDWVAASGDVERQRAMGQLLAGEIDRSLAEAAWALISAARRIVILAHEHPDPDALGSALGLALALEPLGKRCVVACADPVPSNYTFLPGRERVVATFDTADVDLVIALDAGELGRYGNLSTRYRDFFETATILNIDHHVTSNGCGQVNIVDPRSAATAELLTMFLLHAGVEINAEAARCLLAGIITDTRSFEFDATTSRTLLAGAYLVGCGAVPEEIIRPMYRLRPIEKVRLWNVTLDRTLGTAANGRLVWAALRQDYLAETGATADMDDGLPSYLMDIEGVAIAALFKEQADGTTKVSLRAAEPYDAARMSAHFGGGGHVRAAGFSLALRVDAAIREVTTYLEAQLQLTSP
jgi:bifunctional oligoribonuclease and PAP phosphatase NrnA